MKKLILSSNAKVNIGLKIINERSDGYHNIQTLFQEIDFSDQITFCVRDKGWTISIDDPRIPNDDSNTCIQAYQVFKSQFPDIGGIALKLRKSIPSGAGLGGGSSNAATVLKGLNSLYKLDLGRKILEKLAIKIGADVPFFIHGGAQVGKGIGEKLTPARLIEGYYLLVIPQIAINTKEAYSQIKKGLNLSKHKHKFAGSLKEFNDSFTFIQNDFEQVIIPAYPEIGRIKKTLSKLGAKFSSLSGSGSTVFGIFDEEADACSAQSYFQTKYKAILSTPVQS